MINRLVQILVRSGRLFLRFIGTLAVLFHTRFLHVSAILRNFNGINKRDIKAKNGFAMRFFECH